MRGHAERRELGVGKLDEDTFGALACDVDFSDPWHMQQALANRFRDPHQLPLGHAMAFERVHGEVDVRILVVNKRPKDPVRQRTRRIA